ncbi:MAG: hypothetical protein OEY94_08060, partial [Alphaproteobacteria bacterium]|nr:hypothetical protein [Alphaproteobacteria bacterium]
PKRHDTPCNDEKLLKAPFLKSLRLNDKPKKSKNENAGTNYWITGRKFFKTRKRTVQIREAL